MNADLVAVAVIVACLCLDFCHFLSILLSVLCFALGFNLMILANFMTLHPFSFVTNVWCCLLLCGSQEEQSQHGESY